MTTLKRITLFIAINFLVIITVSLVLNLLHVQPFLSNHGLDIGSLAVFCLIWGMGGALISLALSRQMAKWMMGVKIIDQNTPSLPLRELLNRVERLSRQAGLPKTPQVGIFESPEPNAFATGPTKNRSLVAVSTGLLNRMSEDQIDGVLGHEITHIANGDMVTMTLIQGVMNAFVMFLARALAYVFSGMGRNREEGNTSSYASYYVFVFLFEVVFMILGSIVVCAFSRWREFRADRGGAYLAGKEQMIGALQTLQTLQRIQDPLASKPSLEAFKISTPTKRGFLRLFATHPPLEERIHRLQELK